MLYKYWRDFKLNLLGWNQLFGFDTGPGNCLLDEIVKKYTNEEFDHNGELSLTER